MTTNFSGPGGIDDLVIYRGGVWYVKWFLNGTADMTFRFGGTPGDIPLAADVNGDGNADLVINRNGPWYIDTLRDGIADMVVGFGGMPQDIPFLFDWDGDGKADLCIFRDGTWYESTNRDGVVQATIGYGTTGDLPTMGRFHWGVPARPASVRRCEPAIAQRCQQHVVARDIGLGFLPT